MTFQDFRWRLPNNLFAFRRKKRCRTPSQKSLKESGTVADGLAASVSGGAELLVGFLGAEDAVDG